MSKKVNYQQLIPPHQPFFASSPEDILSHRELIPDWISYWDEQKRMSKHTIRSLMNVRQLLSKPIAEGLQERAKSYEMPIFSTFQPLDDMCPPNYLYPSDDESLQRQIGTTTFNVCGWCRYACKQPGTPSSSPSTSCIIRPICTLFPAKLATRITDGHGLSFHSRCLLFRLTDTDLLACIAHVEARQNALAKERRSYASRVQRLKNLLE